MNIYRILDANINRVSEGLRVIEDIMRFCYSDIKITEQLKLLRHELRKSFKEHNKQMIRYRDSMHDIGLDISQKIKIDNKESIEDLLLSNFKRVSEGLRVLEETTKTINEYKISKILERLRYKSYAIEKDILMIACRPKIPKGLYGITCRTFSKGRSNIECVKSMVKAGIKVIQYRDKDLEFEKRLKEAKEISRICKDHNVVFIVNDHIDIALAVDADGVHTGQDDFNISFARNILGPHKIVGKSTHSPEQAVNAIDDGADYIGVGPIFKTTTKDREPVGLAYLQYAVENVDIPFIAIGGIKENNLDHILKYGATRVALVSEVVGAEDITGKAKNINEKIINSK